MEDQPSKVGLQYQKLQASSLVTACTIAHFTNGNRPQLVIFKEVRVEVWEVQERMQAMVATGVLETPVSQCCVLRSLNESSNMDLLLVADQTGGLAVLEWNKSLLALQEVGAIEVTTSSTVQMPQLWLPIRRPLFSIPFPLRSKACTLVTMCLYEGLLHMLSVEWTPNCQKQNGKTPMKVTGSIQQCHTSRPRFQLHFIPLQETNALSTNPIMGVQMSSCVVKGLAFLGAFNEGLGYGSLDFKGRPLLAVLSSEPGLVYHALRLQCLTLNLSCNQLQPGPWEIRNLHPTTNLLIPWCFPENLEALLYMGGEAKEVAKTGLKPGVGVLAISSCNILFLEANGRQASFSLNLEGLPACYDVLSGARLLLGDSSGGLHILELSCWNFHSVQRIVMEVPLVPAWILLHVETSEFHNSCASQASNYIIFACGQTGDSQLFSLSSSEENSEFLGALGQFVSHRAHADGNASCSEASLEAGSIHKKAGTMWIAVKLEGQSQMLDSLAPVHDMLLVHDPCFSPDPFLLLACGSSPTSTLCKQVDLPSVSSLIIPCLIPSSAMDWVIQLLPFQEDLKREYHTHLLITRIDQNTSEVFTIEGVKANMKFLVGLETQKSTFAIAAMPGGWLIQITRASLRVLGNKAMTSGTLQAEWTPPISTMQSPKGLSLQRDPLHHGAIISAGAVVVGNATIYSVQLDELGIPHTLSTNVRPHQVSALGISYIGDSCQQTQVAGTIMVVVGQWTSNTIHLLSWPNLEEIVQVIEPSNIMAPIRSVLVACLKSSNYLFAGTADGNLVFYKIVDMNRCKKVFRSKKKGVEKLPPQYKLVHGHVVKVGKSAVSIEYGNFSGEHERRNNSGHRGNFVSSNSHDQYQKECVYVWSDRSAVLFPKGRNNFEVIALEGHNFPVEESTRLHAQGYPNHLIFLSKKGQLVYGHCNLSIKFRWQKLKIPGSPLHLAYHHSSGCSVIVCTDGSLSWLLLVHAVSMCQVLLVDLDSGHYPTALAVLHLPLTRSLRTTCSQEKNRIECTVLAVQTSKQPDANGILFFLDLQHMYSGGTGEKQVQYKLQLLGLHNVDKPCHSLCMVDIPSASSPRPLNCTMCSLDPSMAGENPWLSTVIESLTNANYNHWSSCCSDGGRELDVEAAQNSLLALGYTGLVQLVTVFVGAIEECMSVVHSVSEAMDTTFAPLLEDVYLLATYRNGFTLMKRNYAAEIACQDEEKAQLELEREIASVQHAQVTSSQTLHSRGVEGIQVSSKDLPSLQHFVTGPCPYMTASHVCPGELSLSGVPLQKEYCSSTTELLQNVVMVTPTGEVGAVTITSMRDMK
ncbi:unnamed protein product [Sphagnum troendelagicum]|uniref:RSE1/DDB1/CPSF1 second beta-propeller domain-containing protein n=1 Tax=Sphagnum troendelagicum TaxID=128251 RepID=A0ABP0TSI7_9BRYO